MFSSSASPKQGQQQPTSVSLEDSLAPFKRAIEEGTVTALQTCLSQNSAIAFEKIDGHPALTYAVMCGHQDIVQALAEHISLDNAGVIGNRTAMEYAVTHGLVAMAKILLKNGARLSYDNDKGQSLKGLALQHGKAEMAEIIEECAFQRLKERLENNLYIDWPEEHVNQLHDVNLPVDDQDNTLLHLAAKSKHASAGYVARLLMQAGAEVFAKNKQGETPYSLAEKNKVEIITEAGKRINQFVSRIQHADRKDHTFNDYGDDYYYINQNSYILNLHDQNGVTILSAILFLPFELYNWSGNNVLWRLLKHNQGDPNRRLKAYSNGTHLHQAAREGWADKAFLLLQYGADAALEDNNGNTPFDVTNFSSSDWKKTAHFNDTVQLLFNKQPASKADPIYELSINEIDAYLKEAFSKKSPSEKKRQKIILLLQIRRALTRSGTTLSRVTDIIRRYTKDIVADGRTGTIVKGILDCLVANEVSKINPNQLPMVANSIIQEAEQCSEDFNPATFNYWFLALRAVFNKRTSLSHCYGEYIDWVRKMLCYVEDSIRNIPETAVGIAVADYALRTNTGSSQSASLFERVLENKVISEAVTAATHNIPRKILKIAAIVLLIDIIERAQATERSSINKFVREELDKLKNRISALKVDIFFGDTRDHFKAIADIAVKDTQNNVGPGTALLHHYVRSNKPDLVAAALSTGADKNQRDNRNKRPLYYVNMGNPEGRECAQHLLANDQLYPQDLPARHLLTELDSLIEATMKPDSRVVFTEALRRQQNLSPLIRLREVLIENDTNDLAPAVEQRLQSLDLKNDAPLNELVGKVRLFIGATPTPIDTHKQHLRDAALKHLDQSMSLRPEFEAAIRSGNVAKVKDCLKQGVSLSAFTSGTDHGDLTPKALAQTCGAIPEIITAIEEEALQRLAALLEDDSSNSSTLNFHADVLVKQLHTINAPVNANGDTLLHVSARNRERGTQLLLQAGADVFIQNKHKQSAYDIATPTDHDTVDIRKHGNAIQALFKAIDDNDLSLNMQINWLSLTSYFIFRGLLINCYNERGETPTYRAAHVGNDSALFWLSRENDFRVLVNTPTRAGNYPIFAALTKGKCLTTLLVDGIDVTITDENGNTPLDAMLNFYSKHDISVEALANLTKLYRKQLPSTSSIPHQGLHDHIQGLIENLQGLIENRQLSSLQKKILIALIRIERLLVLNPPSVRNDVQTIVGLLPVYLIQGETRKIFIQVLADLFKKDAQAKAEAAEAAELKEIERESPAVRQMMLRNAVDANNIKRATLLLQRGAVPTPSMLERAIRADFVLMVGLLLEHGTNPFFNYSNTPSPQINALLDAAKEKIKNQNTDAIFAQLQNNRPVNIKDLNGKPLSLNRQNAQGQTLLHLAAASDNLELADFLMTAAEPIDFMLRDGNRNTAIEIAQQCKSTRVCALLKPLHEQISLFRMAVFPHHNINNSHAFSDDDSDDEIADTHPILNQPAHVAVINLLKKRCDLRHSVSLALHMAVSRAEVEIVNKLIALGVNPLSRDASAGTALCFTIKLMADTTLPHDRKEKLRTIFTSLHKHEQSRYPEKTHPIIQLLDQKLASLVQKNIRAAETVIWLRDEFLKPTPQFNLAVKQKWAYNPYSQTNIFTEEESNQIFDAIEEVTNNKTFPRKFKPTKVALFEAIRHNILPIYSRYNKCDFVNEPLEATDFRGNFGSFLTECIGQTPMHAAAKILLTPASGISEYGVEAVKVLVDNNNDALLFTPNADGDIPAALVAQHIAQASLQAQQYSQDDIKHLYSALTYLFPMTPDMREMVEGKFALCSSYEKFLNNITKLIRQKMATIPNDVKTHQQQSVSTPAEKTTTKKIFHNLVNQTARDSNRNIKKVVAMVLLLNLIMRAHIHADRNKTIEADFKELSTFMDKLEDTLDSGTKALYKQAENLIKECPPELISLLSTGSGASASTATNSSSLFTSNSKEACTTVPATPPVPTSGAQQSDNDVCALEIHGGL